MRRERQATLGKRLKTEGDGGQFPWTYAPQGVKGNKLLLMVFNFEFPYFPFLWNIFGALKDLW